MRNLEDELTLAINANNTEVVKLLLADVRVDPATGDNCAIRWASNYGHIDVVKLLTK